MLDFTLGTVIAFAGVLVLAAWITYGLAAAFVSAASWLVGTLAGYVIGRDA